MTCETCGHEFDMSEECIFDRCRCGNMFVLVEAKKEVATADDNHTKRIRND